MPPSCADLPTFFTPPQAAKELFVDPDTVRGWIKSGELRASNLADPASTRPRYRISRDALLAFLAAREPHSENRKKPRRSARPKVTEYF